jgi:hypothetical protein
MESARREMIMRSRIRSWNETITKLGFKRKKRKNLGG